MAWAAPFDPFTTLGLPRDATPNRIKARYRALARRYHPNRNQHTGDEASTILASQFYHIHQAWTLLSDANVRRQYLELLELYDLHEAVGVSFADLVHPSDHARSSRHRAAATQPDSSDADDDDLPRAGVSSWRPGPIVKDERARESTTTMHASHSDTNCRARPAVKAGLEHSGNVMDQDTAERHRKHERLRRRELEAFRCYQDAMLDKFEAEAAAARCRERYQLAKWRREYFERAPRGTQQRIRLATLISNVARMFQSQQPVRRQIQLPAETPIDKAQFLFPPSRKKASTRRGWSNDITGDQTSSDESDYSSDRASSPRRVPRAQSPRPTYNTHRRLGSGPSLLAVTPGNVNHGRLDDISPISGPVQVLVDRPTQLDKRHIDPTSDIDSASTTSSRSPSSNARDLARPNFVLVPPSNLSAIMGREDRRSRSLSPGRSAPNGHALPENHGSASPDACEFLVTPIGPLRIRNIPVDHVHDLTLPEKQWMLGSESDADTDPEQLMRRLTALEPSVARRFMVKPDIKVNFRFRLIFGHREVVKQQHQTFIALSYRRRAHVEKRHGHFTLPLEPDMFNAVWNERQSDTEGIWIDQICIDSDSEEERTVCMSAMDLVYRSARCVVVVLDDVKLDADEGHLLASHMADFDRMHQIPANKRFRRRQTPYLEVHGDLYIVIRKLLSSSWFRRAWCRHEMRLAREHIFLLPCAGADSSQETSIIRFSGKCLAHLLGLATEVRFQSSIEAVKPALFAFFRDRSKLPPHLQHLRLHHGNFTTVVAEVFAMEAGGDPKIAEEQRAADARKDKISIILNTMECGLALRADVRNPNVALPTSECNYILLTLALAARDPGALSSVGHPLPQLPDVPWHAAGSTWLFEPTNIDSGLNNYRTLHRLPGHAHLTTGEVDWHHFIELDLEVVDSRHILRDGQPSDCADLARRFVSFCDRHRLGRNRQRYLVSDPVANRVFGPMSDIYIDTLARVFERSTDWVSGVCELYGVGRWKQELELASNLLIALKNTGGRWPESDWDHRAAGFIMDFANFLIIRGLPQRQIQSRELWRPVWVQLNGGSIMAFLPPGVVSVAVPTALLDPDYLHLARLWIVKPRDLGRNGSSSKSDDWQLLGKTVLLGDQAAVEELSADGILTRSRQRVFGRRPEPRIHQ